MSLRMGEKGGRGKGEEGWGMLHLQGLERGGILAALFFIGIGLRAPFLVLEKVWASGMYIFVLKSGGIKSRRDHN